MVRLRRARRQALKARRTPQLGKLQWIARGSAMSVAGKAATMAQTMGFAAVLGFGTSLDRYIIATSPGVLASTAMLLAVTNTSLSHVGADQPVRLKLPRLSWVVLLAVLVAYPAYVDVAQLPGTAETAWLYFSSAATIPVAAACGLAMAHQYAAGRALPYAIPLSSPILAITLLVTTGSVRVGVLGGVAGWLVDLVLLRRTHRPALASRDAVTVSGASRIFTSQVLLLAVVLVDQVCAKRVGPGLAGEFALANRIVFAGMGVTLGVLLPRITMSTSAARSAIARGIGRRRSATLIATWAATATTAWVVHAWRGDFFFLCVAVFITGVPMFAAQQIYSAIFVGEHRPGKAVVLSVISGAVNVAGDIAAVAMHSPELLVWSTVVGGAAATAFAAAPVMREMLRPQLFSKDSWLTQTCFGAAAGLALSLLVVVDWKAALGLAGAAVLAAVAARRSSIVAALAAVLIAAQLPLVAAGDAALVEDSFYLSALLALVFVFRSWHALDPRLLGVSLAVFSGWFAVVCLTEFLGGESSVLSFTRIAAVWFCWFLFGLVQTRTMLARLGALVVAGSLVSLFVAAGGAPTLRGYALKSAISASVSANEVAAVVVIGYALILATSRSKLTIVAALAVAGVSLAIADSRGVWLALAITVVATSIGYSRLRSRQLAGLVLVVAAGVEIFRLGQSSDSFQVRGRSQLWQAAISAIHAHWPRGAGYGGAQALKLILAPPGTLANTSGGFHSLYLQEAVANGAGGVLLLAALALLGLRLLARAAGRRDRTTYILLASVFVFGLTRGTFESDGWLACVNANTTSVLCWLSLGAAMSLGERKSQSVGPPPEHSTTPLDLDSGTTHRELVGAVGVR
jgi:O-antigen ligase